jgi:SAM-dependent methyltransferase
VNLVEYERMYRAEENHWWYAGMRAISFAILGNALPRQARPLILDAGCGTGVNLVHMGAHGRTVGIDLSDEALRFSRTRGVTTVRGDLRQLPFAGGSFDMVTSFDVLYHRWVTDDAAAVRELARVLKPGGVLLLRLPALEALRRTHDDAVHTRHRYTRREVRALLAQAGLTLVRDTYCNSLLLPFVVLRSTLDSVFGNEGSDLAALPAPVDWVFRRTLAFEAVLLRHLSLPIGASVVSLARKG